MNPVPVQRWTFTSQSSPDTVYETLRYSDGSVSCDCPGWTRRAVRTCRHTRAVIAGDAGPGFIFTERAIRSVKPVAMKKIQRRFDLEGL